MFASPAIHDSFRRLCVHAVGVGPAFLSNDELALFLPEIMEAMQVEIEQTNELQKSVYKSISALSPSPARMTFDQGSAFMGANDE